MKNSIIFVLLLVSLKSFGLVTEGKPIRLVIQKDEEGKIQYNIIDQKIIIGSMKELAKKCNFIANKEKSEYANIVDIYDKAGVNPKDLYLLCRVLIKHYVYPGIIISIQNGNKIKFTYPDLSDKYGLLNN